MAKLGLQCIVLVGLAVHLQVVFSAKILVWSPTYSKSHVIMNGRIADVLAKAGHDVVLVIVDYDVMDRTFNGTELAKVIRINDFSDVFKMLMRQWEQEMLNGGETFGIHERFQFEDVACEMCSALLSQSTELNWLRNYKFDLAFSEQLELCGVGVIRYLGIQQHIWISSTPLMDSMSYILGVPAPSSYVPSVEENDLSDVMNWWQRANNLYKSILALAMHIYGTDKLTTVFRQFTNENFPSIREIAKESALVFVNSDEFLDFARPILHKVIYIGGMGIGEAKKLDLDWSARMAKGKKGVIVMSLGTVVSTSALPPEQKAAIFKTFDHFRDYHFIWKIDNGDNGTRQMADGIANLDVVQWVPQSDLLAHPRLKLFIMHGGMNGILEAAVRGVPIVTIPAFADQFRNARVTEKRGFGYSLLKSDLNYQSFTKAITSVVTNPRYKTNAVHLSQLIKNKPFPAEQRLLEWTEFVLRFGALPELQVEGSHLSFIAYFCLDIIIPALIAIAIFCIISVKVCLKIWKTLFRNVKSKKE